MKSIIMDRFCTYKLINLITKITIRPAYFPMAAEAEFCLSTHNLSEDLQFFTQTLGMRLDKIYPAEDPAVAVVSGHGIRLRLDRDAATASAATIRLLSHDPDSLAGGKRELIAPNGTLIKIDHLKPAINIPPTKHEFVVSKFSDAKVSWVTGRAGMQYRDLIPSQLGGAIIASHIIIPGVGGPVPDMVHYHSVRFQLIFCYKGWCDLIYEDQGPQFRLHAGNCVIQPPEIRHRVLYSSGDSQFIEVGIPAHHMTTIDHAMTLPTDTVNHDREFNGQKFIHFKKDNAQWKPSRLKGFRFKDTGVSDATKGVASVHVVQYDGGLTEWCTHNFDICFTFLLEGNMKLECKGDNGGHYIEAGDAFVLPPNMSTKYSQCSGDLELLEVCIS